MVGWKQQYGMPSGGIKRMALVSLKNLTKKYPGDHTAVKNVGFDLPDGGIMILAGPSGSGKSTLLRMIAGLEDVSEGEIWIGDREVTGVEPAERNVAMVFRQSVLYPGMTVYDNMAFGLRRSGISEEEIKKRIQRTGEEMGLSAVLDRKSEALLPAESQRAIMARAIVRQPDLLLVDDPLSGLASEKERSILKENLRYYEAIGNTVIWAVQNPWEVQDPSIQIGIMQDGALSQFGTLEQLCSHPVNQFVAGFVRKQELCFEEGRICEEGGDIFLYRDGEKIRLPREKAAALRAGDYVGKTIILGVEADGSGMYLFDGENGTSL
ncbi:MAG: ABC transporter ATP-binding protein [Clostridium sp.]|jgi:multiple sugar transport system ATP-binding protein